MTVIVNTILAAFENALQKKDVQYFYAGCPTAVSKEVLDKGVLIVEPMRTVIKPITTGLMEQETTSLRIIVAKSVVNQNIRNAQKESGMQYLMRVIDGRAADNSLLTNTIRYVIRNNYKRWGIYQDELEIEYDSEALEKVPDGTVTATITLPNILIVNQPLA